MHLQSAMRLERKLGDTESSYFLPSRESGVNDMYLHLGFNAREEFADRDRVASVWAILRMRHPLLASSVEMHDYNDIRFVLNPYASPEGALQDANDNLEFRVGGKDVLIDSYLNGPRILSAQRLSYLILSQRQERQENEHANGHFKVNGTNDEINESDASSKDYDLLICTTHFVGDGMALHNFANDFFTLLSSCTAEKLRHLLSEEWRTRYGSHDSFASLPISLEDRLPPVPSGKLHRLASRVDFVNSQEKLIGGHSFPKRSGNVRRTIVPTVSFDEERTKQILKLCKARGVSISSALFAICSIAWAKTFDQKWDLPIMMYSALNLRPYLTMNEQLHDSYWFIAIGYFNVVLPTFLPASGDLAKTFWHRARTAKEQSTYAAKNRMVVSRNREMAKERGVRARGWAKEDDEKERGVWKAPSPPSKPNPAPKAPSTALIGLSLLGNLDGIYKHSAFPNIRLHTLTTGSRQRPGGMLLFGYTFVGKLWVSLGYDENGFEKEVVDRYWQNVVGSIDELLLS